MHNTYSTNTSLTDDNKAPNCKSIGYSKQVEKNTTMGNKQPTKTKRYFNDFTIDSIQIESRNDQKPTQNTVLFDLHDQLKVIPRRNQKPAIPMNPIPISQVSSVEDQQWKQCVAQYYLSTRYEFPKKKKSIPKKPIEQKTRIHARNPKPESENASLGLKEVEDELKTQILKFQLDQFKFPSKEKKTKLISNIKKRHCKEYDHSFDDFLSMSSSNSIN
ncbi:hypothetical protein NAEGRDRAFT_57039 [Naegleria gruberi]|uniref:Uncharacterized protein n=1 Tax=Naegleria gruberi TaxID=5762 RepID=D2V3V0_NAEGR|nr:uncharacterized protein NAEGRDRAFT_57039 [Naegleria gruberi]EFC48420.1 hypothetical protein NAEGRDRAFT_57039 [Naegleria gruberi]|eukprot:XP_002681164.1 hypothetical protein NAEGRDRAFT_57039 [Naegleria gruberi strain NEG-M]